MRLLLILSVMLFSSSYTFALDNNSSFLKNRKIIMIDLDGVLNNYEKYDKNSIPEIKKGAREFIQKLYIDYDLILFTARSPKLATKWLIENELDSYFKDVTNVKKPAFIYLDDRGIKFNGSYNDTLKEIKKFKTYYN